MAGITSSAVRPIFTFADEGLIQYEKIAAKKLADIIELLELGENSNLQQDARVYLPDQIAQISYVVMEGILDPIILVDIQRQDRKRDQTELEEKEEQPQEEERFYYIPRFEVYITTRNHVMNFYPGNNNCGFQQYPPEGRLIGWEPEFEEGQAYGDQEYGYNHTVESLPGFSYANFFPTWLSTHSCQPGAEIDRRVTVVENSNYVYGANFNDEGFFGDQDWHLTYSESVVVSANGMVACENGETYSHTTTDARRPLDQPEVDFTIFEEELSPWFWHRSIVVGGVTFGAKDPNTGTILPKSMFRPCINIGGDPGTVGEADATTWTAQYLVESAGNTEVLPGEYEIQAYAQSYSCECMEAEVRIRLVLGGRAVNIEELAQQIGGPTSTNVKWTPIMEIVDIVPEDIGTAGSLARFYGRDLVLGGFGNCDSSDPVRGSLRSNSWGFWGKSLYVDPIAGKWRIGEPTWREPFYNNSGCITEANCPESPNDPPWDPGCIGCTGDSSVCKGSICTEHPYCLKAGEGIWTDIRGLAAWSLARIVRVDAVTGKICQVQLIGNDTAQGGPCATKSFSYESCNFASGIDPSIPLGSDLSEYPDQGIIGGWAIGEVVVVIGYTNPCSGRCDGSVDYTGDFRWLVTKTTTGTDDFLSFFWKQLRCPEGIGFENYLNQIIEIGKIQKDCGQIAPDPVTLRYEDGCIKRTV